MRRILKFVKVSIFLLLTLAPAFLYAQGKIAKGLVIDKESGETLIGVTVMIKNRSGVGTITDINGKFLIEVAPEDVLVISFIGYEPVEISATEFDSGVKKVNLEQQNFAIEEFVVVGYGVQSKASSVAAISQATGEELTRVGGVTTVSQAIQGVLPGVISVSDNAKPGADAAEIFIRGKASWNNTSPLVLVDGVERNFNDVDPNEIETLSTLKDASATAVYGVRGANGVILITTKRGTKSKPKVSLTANFGIKTPTAKPKFADNVVMMNYWNEALRNDGNWGAMYSDQTINAWKEAYATGNYGAYNDVFPHVDWWDETIQTGYQQSYNANVRGGTSYVKYFVSMGYLNDGDIFKSEKNELFDPSFKYQRYNWRSNFDFDLSESTRLSVNLAGKLGYRNQPGYRINGDGENGWGEAQFFETLYNSPRNLFPIMYSDGYYGVGSDGEGNVYANINDMGQRIYKYYQNFFDFKLDQKLDFVTKGLSFNGMLSFTNFSNTQSRIQKYEGGNFGGANRIRYFRTYDYDNPNGVYDMLTEIRWADEEVQGTPPTASYDNMLGGGFGKKLYYELSLRYARKFGEHDITALALMNRRRTDGINGLNSVRYPSFDEAWVGRVTYAYEGKYLTEFNAAYTGSEKFAPGKRFGFFPSASVGWRISEEDFIKDNIGDLLTNFKVRYSYGTVGSDNGAARFTYIQTYETSGDVSLGADNKTNFGPTYTEGKTANVNATWETAHKQNLGFEAQLWRKLDLNAEFFKEVRDGILMTRQTVPVWYGVGAGDANIGKTKNKGFELEIAWNDKIGKNFSYYVKANFATSENRIVERDDPRDREEYLKNAGKPIGWQKSYHVISNYQSLDDIYNYATPTNGETQGVLMAGDFMYLDYNGDGVVDSQDQIPAENLRYPLTTYGVTIGGSFKRFSFNALFYGTNNVSKKMANTLLYDFNAADKGIYLATDNVADRWQPGDAGINRPTLHSNLMALDYNRLNSTFNNVDYYYVRLKNLEVSYQLPESLLSHYGVKNCVVYINGNNLFTITDLPNVIDPETGSDGSYPMVRRYNIGFRLNF